MCARFFSPSVELQLSYRFAKTRLEAPHLLAYLLVEDANDRILFYVRRSLPPSEPIHTPAFSTYLHPLYPQVDQTTSHTAFSSIIQISKLSLSSIILIPS